MSSPAKSFSGRSEIQIGNRSLDAFIEQENAFRIQSCFELLRHLREQKSNHYIVLMSSFISVSERELAQDLGAQALLEKPFRLSELLDVVGGLAQKSAISTAP